MVKLGFLTKKLTHFSQLTYTHRNTLIKYITVSMEIHNKKQSYNKTIV